MAIDLQLAVHGAAIVSSLGDDVALACAAAHAGIVRTQELPFVAADEPVVGHVARHHTRDFDGPARLLRLVAAVLRTFAEQDGGAAWTSAPQRLWVCAPNARRAAETVALVVDDDERQRREQEQKDKPIAATSVAAMQRLVDRARALAGWSGALEVVGVADSGNDALATLLPRLAKDAEQDKKARPALVCAVDTLLTLDDLDWLQATARLKTDDNPVGLRPGEAAVLLVVARVGHKVALPELLRIERVAAATEAEPFAALGQPTGRAIAQALLDVTKGGGERPFVLLDGNGETYRANDWGHALVHLQRAGSDLVAATTWLPIAAFGDAGAANAAVALLCAAHAFARGHAPSRRAVVLCCNDTGARTALLLTHGTR